MSAANGQRPLRKRLFVDRHVQGALIVRTTTYWLYCLLTLTLLTLCWRIAHSEPQPFHVYLESLKTDFAPAAAGSLILLPIVLIDVLRVSNRFTGPMFRLRRLMGDLARGEDVPHLAFRTGDYWHDFADDFNAVADRLKSLQEEVDRLRGEAGNSAATGEDKAEEPVEALG